MNALYVQGETASFSVEDNGYSTVVLRYGSASSSLTKTDSIWSCSLDTSGMSGRYNFACIADGRAIETGAFTVRVLVSHYRDVVEAIDAALQGVSQNGKYTVSVGEVSITDKTFDEMVKAKRHYEVLAEAEEAGTRPSFAPRRIMEVYA